MPRSSHKPCCKPGCGNLTTGRFCPQHTTYRGADHRPDARARGYDWNWKKLRDRFIRKNPLCARCVKRGDLVDHVVPVDVAPERRLDETNLQTLCRSCHKVKTDEDKR